MNNHEAAAAEAVSRRKPKNKPEGKLTFDWPISRWLKVRAGLLRISSRDLPSLTAFRFGTLLSKLNGELETFDKTRDELVRKYGAEDKTSKQIMVLPENSEKFAEDYEPIAAEVVSLDFQPVLLKQCGDYLSVAETSLLTDLIVEE